MFITATEIVHGETRKVIIRLYIEKAKCGSDLREKNVHLFHSIGIFWYRKLMTVLVGNKQNRWFSSDGSISRHPKYISINYSEEVP